MHSLSCKCLDFLNAVSGAPERFLFFIVSPKVRGQQNQTALELVPSFYAMDEDSSC